MRDARDVLKSPVISEKSVGLVEDNKYTFWVNPAANKIEIKAAVEKMFKVSVVEIHTLSVKGKKKRVGKYAGMTSARKKAIATLKAGDKIDNFAGL